MLGKKDVLEMMGREIRIVRHLATKVNAANADFRPTEGQRSVNELLQYLSFCASGAITAMVDSGWDRYREFAQEAEAVDWRSFPAAIDREENRIHGLFQEFTHEDFSNKEAKLPTSEIMSLGQSMVEVPLKWLTAYRMQLFLYLKESGLDELSTWNCWGGQDPPKEA